jgi:hypothetical protein
VRVEEVACELLGLDVLGAGDHAETLLSTCRPVSQRRGAWGTPAEARTDEPQLHWNGCDMCHSVEG